METEEERISELEKTTNLHGTAIIFLLILVFVVGCGQIVAFVWSR